MGNLGGGGKFEKIGSYGGYGGYGRTGREGWDQKVMAQESVAELVSGWRAHCENREGGGGGSAAKHRGV